MSAQLNPVVTIGHDAEGFLRQGNEWLPSIGLIGGTKDSPLAVEGSKTGLKVQEDNVTVEINNSPIIVTKTFVNDWYTMVETSKAELEAYVQKRINKGTSVRWRADAEFTAAQLSSPKAREFGCDPDFFAHRYGSPREAINPEVLQGYRFAGGHVHIGYDKLATGINDFAMVQLVEAYCYFPYCNADTQGVRHQYYGLAGLYRPKEYGVEYRTPSNFWMRDPDFVTKVGLFAAALCADPGQAKTLYDRTNFLEVEDYINDPRRFERRTTYTNELYGIATEVINGHWGFKGNDIDAEFDDEENEGDEENN